MDETNRVAATLLSILIISCALLVILFTWGSPDESIRHIADLADYLNRHDTAATQLLITFGALIVVLLCATVIIVQFAPPQAGSVRVAKVGSGEARIGTDEISSRLESELRTVPRLRSVEARVAAHGARAAVKLDLFVDTEADVAETAEQVIQRTREIVEGRMGVELDTPPRAEVHYSDHPPDKRAAAASTPSWQPAAPNPTPAEQPVPSGSVHEATSTAHEDHPTGA